MSNRTTMHVSIEEMCHNCTDGMPASHKIGEESTAYRSISGHNLTTYVCCYCFTTMMGPSTGCFGEGTRALTPEEVKQKWFFPWLPDEEVNPDA